MTGTTAGDTDTSAARGSARPRVVVVGGASRAATALRRKLAALGEFDVVALFRRPSPLFPGETAVTVTDYFEPGADALRGVAAVINFAGIVGRQTEEEFRRVNVEGPARLADAAKGQGVPHFVHISSLSVYGGATDMDSSTRPAPVSAYGRSKRDGDEALARLADERYRVTLLRVPILYGRGTGPKLRQLAALMMRAGVLPVPSVREPRSILHIDNLAVGIVEVLRQGLGGMRFVADPVPFRLDALAKAIAKHKGRRVTLLPLPGLLFVLLRIFLPEIYGSLYARSLVSSADCVALPPADVLPQDRALADIIPD